MGYKSNYSGADREIIAREWPFILIDDIDDLMDKHLLWNETYL
jgi:hypothetical protein